MVTSRRRYFCLQRHRRAFNRHSHVPALQKKKKKNCLRCELELLDKRIIDIAALYSPISATIHLKSIDDLTGSILSKFLGTEESKLPNCTEICVKNFLAQRV